jgi:hypothetical protein
MPTSRFARTYLDYSKEKSTVDFRIRDMTAATIAAVLTEAAALGSAIDALSSGTRVKSQLIQDSSSFEATPPVDPNAQRERKWLVRYQDTVNLKYGQIEIPVAEVTADLLLPNSDEANLADTVWVEFASSFQTLARSVDGNSIEVREAFLVGRNL